MSWSRCLGGIIVGLALVGGCTAPGQASDPQFRLRKAEGERDGLARQLKDEQAKGAALQTQIEAERNEWNSNRAKVAALIEQVATLRQSNEKLQALITERANRPVERPAVAVSPLPAEVDQALQTLAEKYPDRVWYERGRGGISFANDKLFDAGSDVVRPEALPGLQALAGTLATTAATDFEVVVVGHTDDSPITKPETLAKHPSNRHLSVHRAIAVEEVLVKAGVPASRVGVMGYGEYRPVSDDKTRNRRVEVFLVRKGAVQALEPVRPTPPARGKP